MFNKREKVCREREWAGRKEAGSRMSFSLLAFLVVETEPNGQRSIALYGENGVGVDCRVLKAFGESTKRQEKKKSLGTIPISIPPHLLSLSLKSTT